MPKPSSKVQPCIECNGTMTFEERADKSEYKGHQIQLSTEGWWCDTCGESILDGAALKKSEEAFMVLKASVEGLLNGAAVAEIRKRLKLSQRGAGELLGGGPRAFQKYESGNVVVSASMSNLLQLLDRDPKRVEELKEIKEEMTRMTPKEASALLEAAQRNKPTKARPSRVKGSTNARKHG
jgi:HTH-type transcriptional regulator / antitoxin MqsA